MIVVYAAVDTMKKLKELLELARLVAVYLQITKHDPCVIVAIQSQISDVI